MSHDDIPRSENGNERANERSMSRRGMLKATTTAAVGAAGLSVSSGSAAAGGCDYSYPSAPSWFGELKVDSWSFSNWPWGTNDLTLFIHGFTGQSGSGAYAYEVYNGLREYGYYGDVVSTVWPAGDSWDDWYSAKENAITYGQELAQILDYYGWTADHGVNVNLVAHSLGGKMALECVRELYGTYGHSINTVNLLGAAVWDEQPGDRFYYGILYGTDQTHNYYSENDGVLKYSYQSAEFGRHACGYTGGAGGEPWNWNEHDMTWLIDQHCQYMDSNDGCVPYVANDL